MSKPEAFSIPNNTNMTCNTSYHPLPVSRIKQDENMQAVDRSEKACALPCGIFYSVVPLAVIAAVRVRCSETQCFKGNSFLLLCILNKDRILSIKMYVASLNVMVFSPKH